MKPIERVVLDDEGNKTCKDGDMVLWIRCLHCNGAIIAKDEYKSQNVVCPLCKGKLRVRAFKNGRVSIYNREIADKIQNSNRKAR